MKFLLTAIHAKYIHTGLALYSLRSYAGDDLREHVELAEYTINQYEEEILADLYRRKPDVIGFSCYIWNFSMVKKLIREFYKLRPEVPIWLGGPEVSYEYQSIFEDFPEVTGIMIGEGEETFRELLREYVEAERQQADAEKAGRKGGIREKGLRPLRPEIPGTVTKEGIFGVRPPLDMDALPFYYEELDDAEEKQFQNKIIYYESGRGCPFRCSYCLSSIEKSVRLRSPEKVKRELQYFLDRRVKQVKFIDRTFNCNKEHAVQIWRYLSEHDNGVTNFHFEISAKLLTEEELEIFSRMRPGLIQLEIGVQTTNEKTLAAIHRPSDFEKLRAAVEKVRRLHNIHQHLDLIAGLPYEDLESFRRSFDDVYAMKPDQLQLGFLKVLKGSETYERAAEYGIVYQSEPPYEVLYTKWLSYEDVLELKKVEAMVELFYNSGQFRHTLLMLQNFFESPYGMFHALAEFYEEAGYFLNAPARSYRYEILLKFVQSLEKRGARGQEWKRDAGGWQHGSGQNFEAETVVLFRELLTFDFYLREKAKSRPSFARDLHDRYQEIAAFYKKEEEEPALLTEYVKEGFDSRQMMRMTHMEIFHYPVWDDVWITESALGAFCAESAKTEEIGPKERLWQKKEYYILFDYKRKNPLNHEAGYTVVRAEISV